MIKIFKWSQSCQPNNICATGSLFNTGEDYDWEKEEDEKNDTDGDGEEKESGLEINVNSESLNGGRPAGGIDQAMTAHTLTYLSGLWFGFLPKSKAMKIRKNLTNVKAKKRSVQKRKKILGKNLKKYRGFMQKSQIIKGKFSKKWNFMQKRLKKLWNYHQQTL